jgi:hypothetical protein
VAIFVYSTGGTTERAFESKAIDQVKFPPHDYSGGGFTYFLHHKITVSETEMLSIPTVQEREYSFFQSVSLLIRAAVHEQIFLPGVPMVVTEEKDVSTFERLTHHHFNSKILWIELRARRYPLSI